MKTQVIRIETPNINFERLRSAAAVIDAGGLVGLPTETVYGIACRAKRDSLARLDTLKGKREKPYTLHIGAKAALQRYVPRLHILGAKLVEQAWPGPLTIVFELSQGDIEGRKHELGEEVFQCLYSENSIGIRHPEHPVATALLQMTVNAVVVPSANISGQEPAVEVNGILERFAGKIEMVVDAGQCKYKRNSTVVKVGRKGVEVLREGVISTKEVKDMAQMRFLFICTGNTCRSAMAEGIFKKYIAKKLNCEVDQLARMGYKVSSAGTMNMVGCPASTFAVKACSERGVDIRTHQSSGLSAEIIRCSDFLYVMGRCHDQTVRALVPEIGDKCMLLAEGQEIADPIGQGQRVFDKCADSIEKAIKQRISELVL